ncbi:Mitochondrial-processing peptidase subunit beta [Phytophthora cinnamomi]|uniref:Mitochondrial-processing peptidase subunit beta n=1 Tax=Phytophthora cinnamomi TaxID=4785 RepID=UPI0035593D89|nr:Mitochondrial-processing peptidase subunit beta [Phytophthora cinnamomi]
MRGRIHAHYCFRLKPPKPNPAPTAAKTLSSPPPIMLRIIRSPAFQRQVLACGISTTRTLLVALQTVRPPLTSLNGAAASAKLDLGGTLEEVASTHFSESSAFPEFSPMEDTLLSQAVPRIKPRNSTMTSLNNAATAAKFDLNGTLEEVASSRFSESSAFPEFSAMEDTLLSETVPRIKTKASTLTSLNGAAANAKLDLDGTLEEVASTHFSESSAFPEFSPMEDTLLSQAVPRMKPKSSTMTSLNGAAARAHLNLEGTLEEVASSHFSESSAFPEFSPMEDTLLSEAVPHMKPKSSTMTSLNSAATTAKLDIDGTLEEVASSHFSESSAFPEFSPAEDTLLSQAIPRIKSKTPVMDAHALAQGELNEEMQQHFCESSDFPEYSAAEEEAMLRKEE